ncbi:hypothetical protein AY601_4897 [Pedobacter cryoconitis]|uniref:Uncharacterized protein n=1 Tax=Pedobacter cryoconitis TaxID=188932 RepID=A0A127VK78_9SPHI|nr:hypothetical protein [Pedobacter cryoconitis]AMQ01717.1 hypothetical protein AY601_4897 [Pedobacter cryoconitis]
MKTWHIKSHNILLSGDGANTSSLQFNGIWIKFIEQGRTIITQTHQCRFIDTVTADGQQGRIRSGETTRSDGKIEEVFGKLKTENSPTHHQNLMNVNGLQSLFPQGIRNFNNLIYNIRSYNKAHFSEGKNFYTERKGYGKKYMDGAFTLGSTGPLLGSVFTAGAAASYAAKTFSYIGLGTQSVGLVTDVSFSNLYENLVKQSTKEPVIVLDFDRENDSLRDSTGHITRAFRRNIINKHNEAITEESIFQTMIHSVSGYLDGYMKRAKSLQ